MASGMQRVTRDDLEKLLKENYDKNEFVGILASWGDACDKKSQSQVLLLDNPVTEL